MLSSPRQRWDRLQPSLVARQAMIGTVDLGVLRDNPGASVVIGDIPPKRILLLIA
jgi:hypothetical protein